MNCYTVISDKAREGMGARPPEKKNDICMEYVNFSLNKK